MEHFETNIYKQHGEWVVDFSKWDGDSTNLGIVIIPFTSEQEAMDFEVEFLGLMKRYNKMYGGCDEG